MKTLAIETSCDDTSVGIVNFDWTTFVVDSLLAYSQIDDHQKFWWVVPEIASRLHFDKIIEVTKAIGFDAIKEVDFISVTTHPGLPGSLVVGKTVASLLSSYFAKPLVHVNHIYGHIFSLFLERNPSDIQFPLVVLTASWWHNDIYVVTRDEGTGIRAEGQGEMDEVKIFGWYNIAKVWYTLDDAAGECFDKVARMLGGPYPGGQWISEQALKSRKYQVTSKKITDESHILHDEMADNDNENNELLHEDVHDMWSGEDIKFKRIFLSKDNFEFSFSWMKSQVSSLLKKLRDEGQGERDEELVPSSMHQLSEELICDIAYEFQEAVVEVMVKKLVRAGIAFGAKTLWLAGGVSCNDRLWEYLNKQLEMIDDKLEIKWQQQKNMICLRPMKKVYSMDNAAMIGLAGILEFTHI